MGGKARIPLVKDRPIDASEPGTAAPPLLAATDSPSDRDVVRELVSEAIGIERGFLRTFIDLKKKPADVVESYLRGEHTYLNPFRLQFTVAAVWIVVMNFLLDWDTIGREYARGLDDIFASAGFGGNRTPESAAEYEAFVGILFDAIFAKYLIALIIVLLPIQALLCTRFTRPFGISLRHHLTVLSYQGSVKMLVGFFMALGFGIHVLGTMAVMVVILAAGLLGWAVAKNLVSGIPVERFFREHQKEIDKAYRKTGVVIITGSIIAGMIAGSVFAILESH